jgi:hypothetical protein
LAARARDIEISDAHHVQTRRKTRLRQEHGAELARSNHADSDWLAGGLACKKFGMEIH